MSDDTSAASGPKRHLPGLRRQGRPHVRRLRAVVARPAPARRRAPRTSSWCSSTTSASPTSAATAARSPPRTSTRLAARGLRYTNFHSTPMCSPTRAALLTGLRPAPAGRRAPSPTPTRASPATPWSWPTTSPPWPRCCAPTATPPHGRQVAPRQGLRPVRRRAPPLVAVPAGLRPLLRLPRRLHQPAPARTGWSRTTRPSRSTPYPDGYYLTDDLTDRAIGMIHDAARRRRPTSRSSSTSPTARCTRRCTPRPTTSPPHGAATTTAGTSSASAATAASSSSACIEAGTELAPRNTEPDNDVPPWDDLSDASSDALRPLHGGVRGDGRQRRPDHRPAARRARRAWASSTTRSSIFTSDNGASREGEARRHHRLHASTSPPGDDVDADHDRLDLIGGPQTTPHYPRGWAMAGNTPFRLYKINTHAGGHSVPFVMSWPAGGIAARRAARASTPTSPTWRPTLLELCGVDPPHERDGVAAEADDRPLDGAHPARRRGRRPSAPRRVYEMIGHRGFYRDGWEVVTLHRPWTPFDDAEWELYDLTTDPTELRDLAATAPREARRAHRSVGGRGVGRPDLPARRGHRPQVPAAAAAHRARCASRSPSGRAPRRSSGGARCS